MNNNLSQIRYHVVANKDVALILVLAMWSILSGIRWPNIWSVTNTLFDWNYGFNKRGLLGSIINLLPGNEYSYQFLITIHFSFFFLLFAIFIFLYIKLRHLGNIVLITYVLLFSSIGFVFLVHEIGYMDIIGILLALTATLLPYNAIGTTGRTLLCLTAILCHEAFFVFFLPYVLYDNWLKIKQLGSIASSFAHLFVILIPSAILTYLMGSSMVDVPLNELQDYYQSKAANFEIRKDAVTVLLRDGLVNIEVMLDIWREIFHIKNFLMGLLVVLPLLIFNLVLIWIILSKSNNHLISYLLAVVAVISPFALNIVAWDTERFSSLSQIVSFLVLISTIKIIGVPDLLIIKQKILQIIAIILLCLNFGSEIHMFDRYEIRKFPFKEHIVNLVKIFITDEKSFLTIPKQ